MGSIYILSDGEKDYYGSTTISLGRRLSLHKCNNDCESSILNKENLTIKLIEEVEDETQLKWRERYYIENNECVNKRTPVITDEEKKEYKKEYRIKNKETRTSYDKEYYNKNKEKKLQPYVCECGAVISFGGRFRHLKSNKHKKNIP